MFAEMAELRQKALDFKKERGITGTRGEAVIISRRGRARVRFLTKSIDKQWIAYCKELDIPNDETLEY